MKIAMSGLDHSLAPIALREQLSFTKTGVRDLDRRLLEVPGVTGAVLLSTCNRTECYLSHEEDASPDPGALLCAAAGVDYAAFAPAFVTRRGEDCARHLMEVACGLRSRILGEDQILTQVKSAILTAREGGSADSVLETLFRTAAACGKAAKGTARLTSLPASAAHQAVAVLEERMGCLAGRRALVIGNGEMGRLAASLLHSRDCRTTVTLRSYHHGETVVPAGCAVAPYDDRYAAMEGCDLVLSATTSPHYTVTAEPFQALAHPPAVLVDLAIPRDIQPEIGAMPGVTLLNIDSLGTTVGADRAALDRVEAVVEEHLLSLRQWYNYRQCLPALEEVKEALRERLRFYLEPDMDAEEAAEMAFTRTVDLLAGGLKEGLTSEMLRDCAAKIRAHTR